MSDVKVEGPIVTETFLIRREPRTLPRSACQVGNGGQGCLGCLGCLMEVPKAAWGLRSGLGALGRSTLGSL